MKIKYFFLFVWMFPLFLSARINVDSLKIIIKTAPDSVKIAACEELSNYYKSTHFDSCLIICQEGIKLADKLLKPPKMNGFRTTIGTAYMEKGNYESAITYFIEALKISEKYNDTVRIAQAFNNLGTVNMYAKKNDKALEYYQKAKAIKLKLRNNGFTVAIADMSIGIVYKNLKNYDEAYKYYMLALPGIEKSQEKGALAAIYNNIGGIFLFRKQYDIALNYYLLAEKFDDPNLQSYNRAVMLQNIGECYVFLNKPREAFLYLEKSLQIARDQGILRVQKNIYNVLCDYYVFKGDFYQAYLYRGKHDVVKDSMFNIEKTEKIEELQTKYETEKKDQQNQLLSNKFHTEELENQKQKRINRLLILIASIILLSTLLLVYFSHRLRKANIRLTKNAEELHDLNLDLQTSKNQVEAALEFKSQFIANMSHEIRTPLNIIIGFNAMIRKNVTDPKLITFIDAIEVSSNNLLQLLTDILDLSKMEAGKMQLAPENIDLRNMLEDIRKLFVIRAEEKGIDFSIAVQNSVPKGLMLDEVRLRQVLVNLIGNAIKFTDSGFVRLNVYDDTSKKNAVISSSSVSDLIFEIEDSGTGISKKDQTEIFESFKQVKTHSQKRLGGTGLGLPISKRLTEMMGGKILVSSEIEKGSKFSVHFKNIPIIQLATPEKRSTGNLTDLTDIIFEKGSLLIADDEDLNRSLIKACFENTKVTVFEAKNGIEAVEMAQVHKPNLVLMDLLMPDMDGFEAATILKNDEDTATLPIFAFTASHLFDDNYVLNKELFSGFISKPVLVTELYEEVARIIPHTRKSSPANLIYDETSLENTFINDKISMTPETYKTLELVFLQNWSDIYQTNSMNRILEFFNKLDAFANEKNLSALKNYSEEIIASGKSFDIDKVMILLKKFPEIIQLLKSIN